MEKETEIEDRDEPHQRGDFVSQWKSSLTPVQQPESAVEEPEEK